MATDDKMATDGNGATGDGSAPEGGDPSAAASAVEVAEAAGSAAQPSAEEPAADTTAAQDAPAGTGPEPVAEAPTGAAEGSDPVEASAGGTGDVEAAPDDGPDASDGGEPATDEAAPADAPPGTASSPASDGGSSAGGATPPGEAAPSDGSSEEPTAAAGADEGGPPADGDAAAGKKKRRRRRRRRKGKGAEGAAAGSDDASATGGAGGEADQGEGAGGRRKAARPERPAFSVGDQVFGKVRKVTDQAIFVDIAGKATGLFARSEQPEGQEPPKEGDQFIAKVQSGSTRGGMVLLVQEPEKPADAKAKLREALDKTEPVEGWVTGVIKGGVEVDFGGVRAFAPASHVELRPGADLGHLVGEKLPFLVTQYAKKGRDIVVSRKPMLEATAERVREEQLAKIEPDTITKGIVRKVLGWGAFVALPEYGDIEGVVHMTEASHDRGARLGAVMKGGDEIEVKILRVDDKGKLWLSRKGAQKDPWDDVKERYPQWSVHRGKVVRLTEFGAFIQLEPGIDGLCHVSDLALQPVDHPKDAVSVGDEMDVVVSNVDLKGRKIGLHPAPPEEEREERRPRLQAHQKVTVVVTQIRDSGLGVRIVGLTGRAQRGFVPAGHSGTPRGTDLRKEFPLGKRLEAKILEIDPRRGEAKLSIRALKEDAEKQAYREYRKKVQREAHFGTFADLLKKS